MPKSLQPDLARRVTGVVWNLPLLQVQVIPWVISDSNYVRCPAQRLDPSKTVFVGALHGMLNAEALASIMNDLFGGVMYAGIDTDKHKYPIGEEKATWWWRHRCSSFLLFSTDLKYQHCNFDTENKLLFSKLKSWLRFIPVFVIIQLGKENAKFLYGF